MERSARQPLGFGLLALALFAAAYAGIVHGSGPAPDVEQFFFAPDDTSAPLVVAIGGWLLWRRRRHFAALPDQPRIATGYTALALGLLAFTWATLNAANDLLPLSIALHTLGIALLRKGTAGARHVALPCLVLLLAIPIPGPLYNEVVWRLQLAGAAGATWLLGLFGMPITGDGVVFARGDLFFLVIEECSGLRSIRTLFIVALVVGEVLRLRRRAAAALALLALPLGFILNVLRIAIVAAGSDPSALTDPESHVGQGIAVLTAGAVVLFALGSRLVHGAPGAGLPSNEPLSIPWRLVLGGLAVQALLAWTLLPWPVPQAAFPDLTRVPLRAGLWQGVEEKLDRLFYGQVPIGPAIHYRYTLDSKQGAAAEVELFIGIDAAHEPRLRPWSPKLALPGRDWAASVTDDIRIWSLLQDASVVHAQRGDERALAYVFTLHDEGTLRATLRSFFALERGPFARTQRRIVVRLSTPMLAGDLGPHSAARILDRFIGDFRRELAALQGGGSG